MWQFINRNGIVWAIGVVVMLLGISRWQPNALPYIPNGAYSDATTSHFHAASHLYERMNLLWRDAILGGQPFLANPLNKTAYPLQWLAWVFPPVAHLNLMIVVHLLIAGWGMWQLAEQVGCGVWGKRVASLSYVLAPRMVAHLASGHVDIVYALAWLPWLTVMAYRRDVRGLILCSACLVWADVRVALFGLGFITLHLLWLRWQAHRLLGWLGGWLVLSASVWVPLLLWGGYITRQWLTPAQVGAFSLSAIDLIGLLLPTHQGHPETLVYLGLVSLCLSIFGWWSRPPRERMYWAGLIMGLVVWALGEHTPLWGWIMRSAPVMTWFRVPSRAWLLVVFIVSLCAGWGADACLSMIDRWKHTPPQRALFVGRMVAMAGVGLGGVCGMGTLTIPAIPPSVGVTLLLVGGGSAIVLLLGLLHRLNGRTVLQLMGALMLLDLLTFSFFWLEWRTPQAWLAPYDELARTLQATPHGAFYSPNYALPQQVAQVYTLKLFYGVDPFQLVGYVRAIEIASGIPYRDYSVIVPPLETDETGDDLTLANRSAVLNAPVLAEWNVSHVLTTYPLSQSGLSLVDRVGEVWIYRNLLWQPTLILKPDHERTGAEGLPTPAVVAQLHRWTVWAYACSGLGLLIWAGSFFTKRGVTNA
ncbi:MAG: hypothetical protein ACOYLB_14695 [Phototrophicaceae bacterium]